MLHQDSIQISMCDTNAHLTTAARSLSLELPKCCTRRHIRSAAHDNHQLATRQRSGAPRKWPAKARARCIYRGNICIIYSRKSKTLTNDKDPLSLIFTVPLGKQVSQERNYMCHILNRCPAPLALCTACGCMAVMEPRAWTPEEKLDIQKQKHIKNSLSSCQHWCTCL